jgi:uncharacterized membrane protein YkvA (DUF1232 family)
VYRRRRDHWLDDVVVVVVVVNQIKSNQLATKLANNHGWCWRREETNDETVVRTGDAIDETGAKRDV